MTEIRYNKNDKSHTFINLEPIIQGSEESYELKLSIGTYIGGEFTIDTSYRDNPDLTIGGIYTRPNGEKTWYIPFTKNLDGTFSSVLSGWLLRESGNLLFDMQVKNTISNVVTPFTRASFVVESGTSLDGEDWYFTEADYDSIIINMSLLQDRILVLENEQDNYLKRDGTLPMQGNLDLDGYDIDVVNGIRFEQGGFIANLDGNDLTIQLPNGEVFRFNQDGLDMDSNKITGLANGTDETDGATIKNIIDYIASHNNSEDSHDDIRQLINNLDETKLNKSLTSLVAESELSMSDMFVIDKGSGARKITLSTLAEYLATVELELFTIVEALPTENQNPNTIYLVATESEDGGNQLLEYIWIENESRWELIGTVGVDLSDYYTKTEANALLNNKVDKVPGKGLSTEDYTSAEKTKLSGIQTGSQKNSDITKAEIESKLTGEITSHKHTSIEIKVEGQDAGSSKLTVFQDIGGSGFTTKTGLELFQQYGGLGKILEISKLYGSLSNIEFITNESDAFNFNKPIKVNNINVALESEVYSKTDIDTMIGNIDSILDSILGV